MEKAVGVWDHVVLQRDAWGRLLDAVDDRNYPALYACLHKEKGKYLHDQAFHLCGRAIQSGCTVRAFQTILEHCLPELEEFVDYGSYGAVLEGLDGSGGLIQEAAACGESKLLQYMLDHGCNPNARGKYNCSALEAALWNGSIGCVQVLEKRDDVDFTITDRILKIWGSAGMVPERDVCLRMVAGRLLGEASGTFYHNIPILPGLHIGHAGDHENWPLVNRLCRETEVSEKLGKQVLDQYMSHCGALYPEECADLLEGLFRACPGLLRCQYPRYVLTLCMLYGDESTAARLRPWVEQMPGRGVVLCGRRLADPDYDITDVLPRWEKRIGMRLRPVLRKDKLLPVRSMAQTDDETIRVLVAYCAVQGTPPTDGVSRLAMEVVQLASPGLLAELCKGCDVFRGENLFQLREYCEEHVHLQKQQKCNVLMAYWQKEVDYDL